jgi:hypothetical protein
VSTLLSLPTRVLSYRVTVLLLLGTSLSCGGSGGDATGPGGTPTTPVTPTAPVPGHLVVLLTSPNTNDGAILIRVEGGQLDSISLVSGSTHRVQFTRPTASTARLIVVGTAVKPIATGELLNLWVPDVAKVSLYSAKVDQAAARVTYAQRAVDGYVLRIAAP